MPCKALPRKALCEWKHRQLRRLVLVFALQLRERVLLGGAHRGRVEGEQIQRQPRIHGLRLARAQLGELTDQLLDVFAQQGFAPGETDLLHAVRREDAGEPRDLLAVSYTHLQAHATVLDIVCRLLLDNKTLPLHLFIYSNYKRTSKNK